MAAWKRISVDEPGRHRTGSVIEKEAFVSYNCKHRLPYNVETRAALGTYTLEDRAQTFHRRNAPIIGSYQTRLQHTRPRRCC